MWCPRALIVLAFAVMLEPASPQDTYEYFNQRNRHPQYDDYRYYPTNSDYNDIQERLLQPPQRPQLSPRSKDLRGNLETPMRPPHFRSGIQCKTSSGPDPGKACIFPFTYKGTEHNECAQLIRSPESWCATKLDVQDGTVSNWGLCDPTVCFKKRGRLQKKSNIKISAISSTDDQVKESDSGEGENYSVEYYSNGEEDSSESEETSYYIKSLELISIFISDHCVTESGVRCVFPFRYEGVLHHQCTDADHDAQWCSTKTDEDDDHIYGEWGDCDIMCGKWHLTNIC